MQKLSILKAALLALTIGSLPGAASGQTIYGLRTNNALVSFSPATPGTLTTVGTITGVSAEQTLVGMDFRPATGELVALGYDQASSTGRLYTIDLGTAVATPLGAAPFSIVLGAESAANIGFDFNPTVDRIRVVSADINANFRLNPVNGTVAFMDGSLAYAPADVNAARNPNVGSVAYTNSYLGATSTTLFDAELLPNTPSPGLTRVILSTQNPPNSGTLNTTNTDAQSALADIDFDIYNDLSNGTQTGYAVGAYDAGGGTFINLLGTINFVTASITNQGSVGPMTPTTTPIIDIAARIDRTAPPVTGTIAWALQAASPAFVTFDTDNPTFIRSLRTITGITEPQIAGFDTRPATGELYALGYDPGSSSARLYVVAPATGVATAIGAGPVVLTGVGGGAIGFDFNPTVDRIRVVSSTGKNFRLNPVTGAIAFTDGDLAYASGDPNFGTSTNIGAAAYTNSFAGSTATTLYTIDEQLATLNTQVPPNSGTQNTVGSLGLTLTPADRSVDLDILYSASGPSNTAFLTANVNGANPEAATFDNLYTVNLGNGSTTLVGRIGGGIAIRDIALRLPTLVSWTGAVSTNYNTAGNWSNNQVPTTATAILIPSEPVNQPTLTGAGAAGAVVINAGATLTLAANATFDINGSTVVNGTLSGNRTSSTTLVLPTQQTLGGNGTTLFGNLRVAGAGGAALNAAGSGASVQRILALDFNLITNGRPLTLLSDINSTAMVNNNGGVVVGSATVQRYINTTGPGGPTVPGIGYRHLSAPVSNTTFADLAATGYTPIVNPAFNTAPNPLTVSPYPNIFGFDETRPGASFGDGYFSPASLASPMVPGKGYSVAMVGTAKPDFVGTLGNGPVAVTNLTRTGSNGKTGWHLLGNPYPSPIDWDLVTVPAGMNPTISVFRTTGGANGTYTQYTNGVGAPGADLIASAQGFFAEITGAGPVTLTFTNAARVTTYANPAHYRPAADARPTAHLTLHRADQPATTADEAFVYFQNGATTALDRTFDARKMRAEGESASIFTLARGQELAINGLPAEQADAATVALGIVAPVAGTYELTAEALRAFAPGTAIVLLDQLTGTSYDLNLQPTVRFTVAQAGQDLTRFALRFGRGSTDVAGLTTASLDVYPNPVGSGAALRVEAAGVRGTTMQVELVDALGRTVIRRTVAVAAEAASLQLDTRTLRAGAYTLRLTSADATPITRQVVVE
jgi:trimeric autotransporter adhesin